MKPGDKIQYAIRTGATGKLKIKPAAIVKMTGDKIYLDSSAILYLDDEVPKGASFKHHHDFKVIESKTMKKSELKKIIKEELKSVISESSKLTLEQMYLDRVNEQFVKIINNINTKLGSYHRKKANYEDNKFDDNIKFWTDVRNEIKQMNGDSRQIYLKIKDYEEERLNNIRNKK